MRLQLAYLAGLGAFLGHLFPVWLSFQGGKGVATYHRRADRHAWPAALVFCLVWLAVAICTRYSSLAALAASASPSCLLSRSRQTGLPFILIMSALLMFCKHHANIRRLLDGEESKIGATSREPADPRSDAGAAAAGAARRRPAAGLPAADPQRQRRARHLPRAHQSFGGAEPALAALPELSRRGGAGGSSASAPREAAEAELEAAARIGAHPLFTSSRAIPPRSPPSKRRRRCST